MTDFLDATDREPVAPKAALVAAPSIVDWDGNLIDKPGAYRNVPIRRYHGAEICSSASISGSGLKVLANDKGQRTKGQTPRHFWERSNLNQNRRQREDTDALRMGRAFHDALLLPSAWETDYHFLPEGFSRAAKVKMAAEIADADAAIAAGKTVISINEHALIEAMVEAMMSDSLATSVFGKGEAEVTLAWQDAETGIWLRARPDWIREDRKAAMNVKTDADASYSGFSKSIAKFGYAQGAALELDGYAAVFGEAPPRYFHPVIEKPTKDSYNHGDFIATALWELPEEDIERGRFLNRQAIRTFADCLTSGKWPGYTPEVELCGLPSWARHVIDGGGAAETDDDEISA